MDQDIEKAFIDYFLDIYTKREDSPWMIGNLNWRVIDNDLAASLTTPFTDAEVVTAYRLWVTIKLRDLTVLPWNFSKISIGIFSAPTL